jgi:DNA modification methylase
VKPYYESELVTIYHGDCQEILPRLEFDFEKFDLLLTDPPYGINEDWHKVKSRGKLAQPIDYGEFEWDKAPPSNELIDLIRITSKHQIIWGGNFFHLPPTQCYLVWDKDNNSNDFADCELAWTNLKRAVRKLTYRWNGMLQENMKNKEIRWHPTQKPQAVMNWCLSFVPETKTMIDPFMGAGSSLLAARRLGIKSVGIDKDERYCQSAIERLSQLTLPLFTT